MADRVECFRKINSNSNAGATLEANYADKLGKISNCLASWELRKLTIKGKITALKSLIVSQLVYILSPLPTNQKVLEELKTRFLNFYGAIRLNGL